MIVPRHVISSIVPSRLCPLVSSCHLFPTLSSASHLLYACRFHKVHHELTAPIGVSAFYMHWSEFVGMAFAGCLGAMAVNAHALSAAVYFGLGAGGGVLNHSGFRIGPLDPAYHDFHHEQFRSNISFLGIMDVLHGTNKLWRERAPATPDAKKR